MALFTVLLASGLGAFTPPRLEAAQTVAVSVQSADPDVNPCRVWVNGYTRKNGTRVSGYWRTCPNSTVTDNFSFPGNFNPNTGKVTGGAATSPGGSTALVPIQPTPSAITIPPPAPAPSATLPPVAVAPTAPAPTAATFTGGMIAAAGVSIVSFTGTTAQLNTAGAAAKIVTVTATVGGKLRTYVVGAPDFVNAEFNPAFPAGLSNTLVIVKR